MTPSPQPTQRFRWAVGLLLALAMVASACAGDTSDSGAAGEDADAGPAQYGGKMVYGLEAETTNGWCLPEGQLAIAGIQVARSVYDTLTVPNGDGDYVPFLAESVTSNDDFTEWTIELQPDITFHDGSELTAEVVRNNLDAYRGEYPGRSSLLFQFVFKNIAETEVVDPLTVKVTTETPWSSFPSFLYSSGRVGIMSQSQLDDDKTCGRQLVGTGPFAFEDWKVNSSLKLKRNEDYWRSDVEGNQLPYLDELEFRPVTEQQQRINGLKSGELDAFHTATPLTIDELRTLAETGEINLVESADFTEVGNLMTNATKPPFDNHTARMAIAHALDIELANEVLGKGIPPIANGPFSPGVLGHLEDTGFPRGDAEKAKELVKKYEDETGKPFKFTITSTPDPDSLAQVNMVAKMYEDVGMDVSVTTLEQSALIDTAISRNYQLMGFRQYPGLDPDGNYVWWYDGETNPVNFSGFSDPEIDELLDAGRATDDKDERQRIYGDLNQELADEGYLLWTTWTTWAVPMQPKVHGVVGARPTDGSSDFTGLALGHDMAYMWKEQ